MYMNLVHRDIDLGKQALTCWDHAGQYMLCWLIYMHIYVASKAQHT